MWNCAFSLPGSIKTIPQGLFSKDEYGHRRDKLLSIILNEGTETIERDAFANCAGIQELTIPESVRAIGKYPFGRCTGLKRVNIPKHITKIPDCFFAHSGIVSVSVPDYITEIGEGVFDSCYQLEVVDGLPRTMDKLPSHTFMACKSLKEIQIPDNIKTIGEYAFSSCSSLSNIKMNANVTLEKGAFRGCEALTDENGLIIVNDVFFGCSESIRKASAIEIPPSVSRMDVTLDSLPIIAYRGGYERIDASIGTLSDIKVGDVVPFGMFPEKDDLIMRPIQWKVLAVEENRALLMTAQSIMSHDYHLKQTSTWDVSPIRELLNGAFYNIAFSDKEKSRIITTNVPSARNQKQRIDGGKDTEDKLFLLSVEEVESYLNGSNDRIPSLTEYAISQTSGGRGGDYVQLRTPGKDIWGSVAYSDNLFEMTGNHGGRSAISPVMWVSLT